MSSSLNQTFDETRAVKVLVVPIGKNAFFDKHFQIVSNLREIPFYELNRPYNNTNSSAFKYFNWKDGNILFDFIRYDRAMINLGVLNEFQYPDRILIHLYILYAYMNEKSSRRILMIMGLINYPEIGETKDKIEEELEYFAKRHQYVMLKRIFVFNYAFDEPPPPPPLPQVALSSSAVSSTVTSVSEEEIAVAAAKAVLSHTNNNRPLKSYIKDSNSLIIFPPEGNCEGGVSMIDVHLKEIMSHASLSILLAFEQQMKLCEESRISNRLPEQLPLSTLFDEIEEQQQQRQSSGTSTLSMAIASRVVSKRIHRKKPSGRIHKWMGDLSMQVCSPRDAIDHYAHAINDCRSLNETLWLAGALDGYASAVLLLVQMTQIMQQPSFTIEEVLGKELLAVSMHQTSLEDIQQQQTIVDNVVEKAFRIAEERMNEAISIYSNNIIFCAMEVECILRAARIQELVPLNHGQESKVMSYLMKAISVDGLNIQQQIECMLEAGLICYRLGMKRKYALFLFLAAILSIENESFSFAQSLLNYTCGACNDLLISSELLTQSTKNQDVNGDEYFESNKSKMFNLSKFIGWKKLKFTLFLSCVLIADQQDDTLAATHELGSINLRQATTELLHYQDDSTSTSIYSEEISLSNILEYLSKVLSSRMYSEQVFDLFAKLSKLIAPQSFVELPITLLSLQPIEFIGYKKPIAMLSHTLENAKINSMRYKQYLLVNGLVPTNVVVSGVDLLSTTTSDDDDDVDNKNNSKVAVSSLFYDPFAAKRKKELDSKKQKATSNHLCWIVGELCQVKANFQNPLAIPLLLDSVWPIFIGAEHEVHSTPIQIPPNTESFEVTFSMIPLHIGTLKLIGLQIICSNNATCILEVDETGNYTMNKPGIYRPKKSDVHLELEAYTINVVPPSPTLQIVTENNEHIDENIINSESIPSNNNNNINNNNNNSNNNIIDGHSEYADTCIHMSLYPGEERYKTICLRSIPLSRILTSNSIGNDDAVDKEVVDMYENDYKVFIKQYNNSMVDNNTNKYIVLNYSNTFTNDIQNTINTNLSCTLNKYHHNVINIEKQDYYGSSPRNLSTLTFKFIDNPNLNCIDIVIEIVNIDKKTSNFIKDFQIYDETKNNELLLKYTTVEDIESVYLTNIYTRQIRLRVYIHHLPGLLLTKCYHLLSPPSNNNTAVTPTTNEVVASCSHIHLPIPDYEAERLAQALTQLLGCNHTTTKYNSFITLGGVNDLNKTAKIMVDIITSSVKVVYEITNKSDRNIYVGTEGMQTENISTNLIKQISKCMLLSSDQLICASKTPMLMISPNSSQSIIIEYKQYIDTTTNLCSSEKEEFYLLWSISDDYTLKRSQRSGKVPFISNSNSYNFMNISNKYIYQNQITRKSLVNMISSIYKDVKDNKDDKLSIIEHDDQLGNLYLVKVGKFINMTIEISPMILLNKNNNNNNISINNNCSSSKSNISNNVPRDYEVEIAIVIVNNESPYSTSNGSYIDPCSIINNTTTTTTTTTCECVITGRRYMKYLLRLSSNNNNKNIGIDKGSQQIVIKHSIQLCFPKEGSYSIYPIVRAQLVHHNSDNNNNKDEEDFSVVKYGSSEDGRWWTSPTAYIRVISSSNY